MVEIGAMASKLANELSESIGTCVLRAQLLERRARRGDMDAPEAVALAEKIIDALKPLMDRVETWVEFARTRTFILESVPLGELFERLMPEWKARASARRVAIRAGVGPNLPRVKMDVAKMRVVFDHVVDNALEAVRPGSGALTIAARAVSRERVRIDFDDNGPGVDAATELFALFTTTRRGAAGLGLAVSKEIVSAHGGTIEHSTSPLGGSRFTIELPVKPPISALR